MPEPHATPDAIPPGIAQAIAQTSLQGLEEMRSARKEMREEQRAQTKELAALKEQVSSLRAEVAPALKSYGAHLDRLQETHAEALQEAQDARLRLGATISGALTSKPAIALWGAVAAAVAGVLARYLGAL